MVKYILLGLFFVSCDNLSRKNSLTISTTPLDTVSTSITPILAKPALFEAAFAKGTSRKVEGKTVELYGVNIGKIKISSGFIVACDPGHMDEYGIPFTQRFPTGEFPVQLSVAKVESEETIAFARILFSEEPVAKWEFALKPGEEQVPLGGKKMHGYSVDLGIGMFADQDAVNAIDKRDLTDLDADLYQDMDKNYRNDWRFSIYNFAQHNLALFSSGFGDGYYATYIGFDSAGAPCRVLTDFRILDWKKDVE